ncbi:MAG: hypothetical protein EPN85_14475 [Bacteroidetes bacterium]|nr:MAG: hypothetical protein EPN85_14475 [Bacteroidota bacterium]
MKNLFLATTLFLTSVASASAQLTVVTLHHNGTTTPFYSNSGFVDAYTASVAGDTIILPGGNFNPPASIDKRLTIIGTGHYPDSTGATGVSFVTTTITLSGSADSSCIEGLYINGSLNFTADQAVDYVLIKKNFINGSINFSGSRTTPCIHATLINNIVAGSLNTDNANTLNFSNNIVNGGVRYLNNGVVQNNVFLNYDGNWGWNEDFVFYYSDQSLIQNNIIIHSNVIFRGGAVNNTVSNNLFIYTPSLGSGVISGNYFNVPQASIFTSQTGNSFNYTHNYHLQSPGTYLGTDGTQVGIYGGYYPYKEAAVPGNPHIQTKTIAPTTTPAGDLNINIKVKAQDN